MSDDYDDEERAFRDALHRAAAAEQFDSLEPSEVMPSTRRSFGWPAVGGVAAVAAVLALAVFVAPRAGMPASGSAAAPPSAQVRPEAAPAPMSSGEITVTSADDGGGATAPASGEGQPREASLGPAAPGFRWVVSHDVAVQVPEGWGEGMAPGTDWCATDAESPSGPFVDQGSRSTMAIACTGPVPASRLALNLQFWQAGTTGPDLEAPWSYKTVVVGDTTVVVTTDGTQPDLVSQILGSAVAL